MIFDEWWKEMKPAECDELKDYFVECWNEARKDVKNDLLKLLPIASCNTEDARDFWAESHEESEDYLAKLASQFKTELAFIAELTEKYAKKAGDGE